MEQTSQSTTESVDPVSQVTPVQAPQPPVQPPPSKYRVIVLLCALVVIALGVAGFFAYQNYQLRQQTSQSISTPNPSPAEAIVEESDLTADWKTIQTKLWQFKVPSTWNYLECTGNTFIYVGPKIDKDKTIECNFDSSPGIMYVSREVDPKLRKIPINTDPQYDPYVSEKSTVQISNLNAVIQKETISYGQGAGTTVRVYISKPDYMDIITLTDLNEKKVFDQILSTFKFTGQAELTPTVTPKNVKLLTYSLPSGWNTATDPTGAFEVGYDPVSTHAGKSETTASITLYKSRPTPTYGNTTYLLVQLLPYDNGSRHAFIYKTIGNTPVKQDYLPNFREVEYAYNNHSCLFLFGIGISQIPTTWGMCDVGGNRAFAIFTWENEVDLDPTLKTIKLLN